MEPLLAELGVAHRLPEVTGARFPGVRVGWNAPPALQPFGEDAGGPWLGYQVNRRAFDAVLLARAEALGAEVRFRCGLRTPLCEGDAVVGAETDIGERIAARMLIDAGGPAAWLSRRLGVAWERRSPALTVRYGYIDGVAPAVAESPELIADADGWRWTARVSDGLTQWARLTLPGRPAGREPPDTLARLPPFGPARGADATWRIAERTAGPGWFLTGEAASSVDPTSSKGVLKALTSGLFAGRTTAAVLTRGAPAPQGAAAYDRWVRRGFEGDVAVLAPLYAALGAEGFGTIASPRRAPLRSRP